MLSKLRRNHSLGGFYFATEGADVIDLVDEVRITEQHVLGVSGLSQVTAGGFDGVGLVLTLSNVEKTTQLSVEVHLHVSVGPLLTVLCNDLISTRG